MSLTACFTCHEQNPAGNSAYCAGCQPVDTRQQPRGSQCGCAACGLIVATLTDFDRHQERAEGVFTGRCHDPVTLGLELVGGVWGTPEGNANRARLARDSGQLRGARKLVARI